MNRASHPHAATRRLDLIRRAIVICTFIAALPLVAIAQLRNSSSDSARILSLENAWNEAEVHHDVRSLSLVIADTFVYTDSDGSYLDKEAWLNQVKSEAEQYEQLANSNMRVLIYDNAAVVTGEYREKIQIKGKFVLRSGRFTDTWIRHTHEWKCVASQATLISR